MSFQNYSSADFINGQRPNPPVYQEFVCIHCHMLKADKIIWSIYCYISRDSRMLPVSIGGYLASMVLIGPVNSKCKKYYGVKGRYIMVKRRIKWNLVATRSGINTQHAEETRNTRWWYNFGVLPHPVCIFEVVTIFPVCILLPLTAYFTHCTSISLVSLSHCVLVTL
ncbi:uncharacterized protein EV154DRAFT_486896 [Mucor mucedo]|uniref:uncharacterized protein n=1 Tax=Mucor mucedo TaxID=29922 RepID=UPI00221E909A|nr:uncharacterized protein EV154DRAFT_486896 [Mucor mucedo]KAI7874433.1 hypothetical protein EV154DRAFT_486896 [Mucor mucedo]